MKDVTLTPPGWSGQPHSVMEWLHPHLQLNEILLLHPFFFFLTDVGNKAQKKGIKLNVVVLLKDVVRHNINS